MLSLLFSNPFLFLFVILAIIICLSIHEFAHAYVADKLGDPTARYLGRVTLNPMAHLDPLGTALLVLAGFGWGKPVPFNPINLENPKRDGALIALAGPVSNFILAALLAAIYHLVGDPVGIVSNFLYLVIFYNLILGIFNLIPVNPLDGFKVVNGVLSDEQSESWMTLAPYGMYILLLMIITDITDTIIFPATTFLLALLGL